METGKILLGVLAGVAAGAILGILIAPDKGSVTRKKICTKGEDLTDSLKEKFGEYMDSISNKYESMKEDASEFADHFKAAKDDVIKDFQKTK
jgi:gas vesicle protein